VASSSVAIGSMQYVLESHQLEALGISHSIPSPAHFRHNPHATAASRSFLRRAIVGGNELQLGHFTRQLHGHSTRRREPLDERQHRAHALVWHHERHHQSRQPWCT